MPLQGHYFHIDFGFVLGHSTGKQIGGLVECSNFKLTDEYVELLGGDSSPVYHKFCDGCVQVGGRPVVVSNPAF